MKPRKLKPILLALVASMCSLTAWARTAPTLPEAQTLESGSRYIVYNVNSNRFLRREGSDVLASSTQKSVILITSKGDETYSLQFVNGNSYMYTSSGDVHTQNGENSYSRFRITETEGGYLIQRNYNYDADQYVGDVGEGNNIRADQAEGNIVWQLFNVDEADYYCAQKALFDALEAMDEKYAFAIDVFDAIYENESSTTAELNAATKSLQNGIGMSTGYQAPWWNERPILFYTADGSFGQSEYDTWALPNNSHTSGTYFKRRVYQSEGSSSISATVLVEEPSTLIYGLDGSNGEWIRVYIDGTEVRALCDEQYFRYPSSKTYTRFFEELEPGLHTITWTCTCTSTNWREFQLYNVSVMSKPQITVSLLEPGSLGTEVLYNTDHIKNVRRLKVKGAMNNDDWARIKMMSTLLELDLSEAQFTEIPANQFEVSSSDTTMNFLHKIVLPEGLKTIGDEAFYYSFVEEINLPSTMKRVGKSAFYRSHVKELIMPDDMTDFYGGSEYGRCFENMYWLKKLVLPKNLTVVPRGTFYWCPYITEAVMPEKLQTVEDYGFFTCHRMKTTLPEGLKKIGNYAFQNCIALTSPLPETLTTIGQYAFQYDRGYKSLVIPQSVTSIGQYAFADCTNLTKVELGVNQYSLANGVFQNCSKLDTVKLKSPTVTTISSYYPLSDITKVVLQVPHYLVNSYKLHEYWYNAKAIEPFDYSSIEYIPLRGNLTLNHERFGGQPSITIYSGNYLKINGESEQKFNEIWIGMQGGSGKKGQLLNNCENITAIGDNRVSYWTDAKKWYFISLPFDLDMSRITPETAGTQYAIRYYDGAGRAANGKSGNWKDVDRTGIIPAGTGFIFQTNIATYTQFFAGDTENKYGTLRNTEFVKTLAVNASETTSNKGWNLVGNPYQCYYNNHCLNFTAPITIWNPDNKTYTAYSLTDDDYAICPNEAFFVQCPNEEYSTIGFPLQGRQLTSVIESQNAVKELASQANNRQVVNLTVSNGEMEDMTRVVLNEEASMAYETSCDASKFMSMDSSVPQIYTLDAEGTQYAINERPMEDGSVALGFYAGQEGSYTISVTRCDAEKVFITDNLTGETTDITNGAYTFSAKAGTDNTRFTLSFVSSDATAINEIDNGQQTTDNSQTVYDLNGRQIVNGKLSNGKLPQGIYVIRQGKKASKVVVR